jgi:microcin C transport system ATP-binding protein
MLLDIKNFCVDFHTDGGLERVLDRVSLAVGAGKTTALVGESGSGKSVTALSILRLLEYIASVSTSGDILFEGKKILQLTDAEIRKIRGNRISMIFQEPMTSLNPVYTIGDQLLEPLVLHQGLSKKDAQTKALELLERTGIPDPEHRMQSFSHQLSGGQRQRVMIAMALACRPALLIADEPTTALDVTIQAQILALIKDVQQEFGMAVLLITHDLAMVRSFAEDVYIMHNGRIVEQGTPEQVFKNPRDSYTIHLLESVPKGEPEPKEKTEHLLAIKDLRCHFPIKAGFFKKKVGVVKAVDDVTLTIDTGKTFAIVGESGSGKTTLGLSILRLVRSEGVIKYKNKDLVQLSNKDLRPLRKDIQVVFQDPFSSLSPRLTIEQIISEGLQVHGIGGSKEKRRAIVKEVLSEVGLEPEMADRYPHEFSGGQRQRIAIARAVVLQPGFMVLDEPTSALDMTIQEQILQLLKRLQKRHNMTYLFISHDLRVVRTIADDVAVMKDGKIVEAGPAVEIFNNPQHPYTKKLFAAAFDLSSFLS